MTPEERSLLTKSIKLAEENNKILRGIRRSARISYILRIFYWLIIISLIFSTYYFVQPYIDTIVKNYHGIKDTVDSVKNVTTNLPDWLGDK